MNCEMVLDLTTDEECGEPAAFLWNAIAGKVALCPGCAASPYIFPEDLTALTAGSSALGPKAPNRGALKRALRWLVGIPSAQPGALPTSRVQDPAD